MPAATTPGSRIRARRRARHQQGVTLGALGRIAGALVAIMLLLLGASGSPAANSGTVVGATVLSATSLDAAGCPSGVANVTSFGSLLPGTSTVTTQDCSVTWGSSNDTAMLRAFQTDGAGAALLQAPSGALDPTFGTAGVALVGSGSSHAYLHAFVVQEDGRIVAAGSNSDGCAVARFSADGAVDASFGTGGLQVLNWGLGRNSCSAIVLQPDGRIVVAGFFGNVGTEDAAFARLTPTGALDASFGAGGKTTWAQGPGDDRIEDLALQSNGRIVGAGWHHSAANRDATAVRLTSSGAPDASFGSGGLATVSFQGGNDEALAVAIQLDGRVVIAGCTDTAANAGGCRTPLHAPNPGRSNSDFAIARLLTDGTPDPAFGAAGKVITPMGVSHDTVFGLALQADGKLVAFGKGETSSGLVARYLSDGALDPAFGTAGRLIRVFSGSDSGFYAGAITADGHIVAVGDSYAGFTQTVVVRLNVDGTSDTTFGGGSGQIDVDTSGTATGPSDGETVAFQSGGRIVVGGSALSGGIWKLGLYRLSALPVPDYVSGSNSWLAGANHFGACLRSVTGSGVSGTWTINAGNTCPAIDGAFWNSIAPTSASPGATVAQSTIATTTGATAHLRFGFRTSANQPPGVYTAPITVEVIAPKL